MSGAQEWQQQVERHFGFLTSHGYLSMGVNDSKWWEVTVTYQSPENAVLIKNSREFGRVELELVRLDDQGQIPDIDIWVGPQSDGHALFDNVIEARAPSSTPKRMRGTAGKAAERALATWARLLREVAPDFLTGSNVCIEEAHQLVLKRVNEKPQVLTINLPSTATDNDERAAVADARANTPDHVRIKVQRYRHRRR